MPVNLGETKNNKFYLFFLRESPLSLLFSLQNCNHL